MNDIESAFKSQGFMLSQSLRRLENHQTRTTVGNALTSSDGLQALWHRSRELHYVAHFREPLDVNVGDIGYITGNPLRFIRLDNVYDEISDGYIHNSKSSQSWPLDRWTTEEVQGIRRYVLKIVLFK